MPDIKQKLLYCKSYNCTYGGRLIFPQRKNQQNQEREYWILQMESIMLYDKETLGTARGGSTKGSGNPLRRIIKRKWKKQRRVADHDQHLYLKTLRNENLRSRIGSKKVHKICNPHFNKDFIISVYIISILKEDPDIGYT